MAAIRDTAGTLRTVAGISMRDAGGVLRSVGAAFIRDAGGVLRQIFSTGSASVDPTAVGGFAASGASVTVTTTPVTVTPTGGSGPYTYAWAPSPAASGWDAVSPASATTAFRKTSVNPTTNASATFACTITDAHGNIIVSDLVTATVTNIGAIPIYFF